MCIENQNKQKWYTYGTKGFVTRSGLFCPPAPLVPLPAAILLEGPKNWKLMIMKNKQNSIRLTSIMFNMKLDKRINKLP